MVSNVRKFLLYDVKLFTMRSMGQIPSPLTHPTEQIAWFLNGNPIPMDKPRISELLRFYYHVHILLFL